MSDDPLIGTWRLVSFEVRDEEGRITYPFGRDAVGFITYTADGHMAVQFGRADRARLAVGDWVGAAPDGDRDGGPRLFRVLRHLRVSRRRGHAPGGAEPDAQLDRRGTGAAGRVRRPLTAVGTAYAAPPFLPFFHQSCRPAFDHMAVSTWIGGSTSRRSASARCCTSSSLRSISD